MNTYWIKRTIAQLIYEMNLWLHLKFLVISMNYLVTEVLYFNHLRWAKVIFSRKLSVNQKVILVISEADAKDT